MGSALSPLLPRPSPWRTDYLEVFCEPEEMSMGLLDLTSTTAAASWAIHMCVKPMRSPESGISQAEAACHTA